VENMSNFKTRLQNRGYPARIVENHLSEIKFSDIKMSLAQKNRTAQKNILLFVTQYHWGNGTLYIVKVLLREIFKEPPTTSYRKGKSQKLDILVKAVAHVVICTCN